MHNPSPLLFTSLENWWPPLWLGGGFARRHLAWWLFHCQPKVDFTFLCSNRAKTLAFYSRTENKAKTFDTTTFDAIPYQYHHFHFLILSPMLITCLLWCSFESSVACTLLTVQLLDQHFSISPGVMWTNWALPQTPSGPLWVLFKKVLQGWPMYCNLTKVFSCHLTAQ